MFYHCILMHVYSNQITRDVAERQKINTSNIYRDEKMPN